MPKKILPLVFLFFALVLFAVSILVGSVRKIERTSMACTTQNFSGNFEEGAPLAEYYGNSVQVPAKSGNIAARAVLGSEASGERYIEIDLSEQKLRAWDGSTLFLETPISSGLPYFPTPQGEFRIWAKLRYTRMRGGEGRYYYNLPNVPFVMYFQNDSIPGYRGYGIHGAYWHNDFGRVHSHGCVNLPIPASEKLYYWTTPTLPEGKNSVFASADNPGTRIVIHE